MPETTRALSRGLAVLAALNRTPGASTLALARATGLPRPSVHRLLETLRQEGYVARSPSDERWVLRPAVRALGDGFQDEAWVTQVAAPMLFALTERIGWPSDLATRHGTEMVIRETTHRRARFSIDHGMAGHRLPILHSSLGRCWLAFAPAAERDGVLGLLHGGFDRAALLRDLAAIRRRGHALREGTGTPWPHTGSVALPVRAGGRLLGCVNAIWMARAVTPAEGLRQCLEPLRAARDAIEAALAEAPPM
ncbi:helix-turn-helix domain-containing protein [Roseococcus sp. DSY-14]|uniref:helix-turn-helix domain-containing protein n=1 Tax=Roseococcus sp. DSY-14 TaxID=3369650 RepID=UPI00387B13F3